jgi:hypothetical protein
VAAPSVDQTPVGMVNRYYYHWLLDTDNNPATGRSNAEYEGNPTGVQKPVGVERVIMIGWRNGLPNGVEVYDPLNEDVPLKTGFTFQASGNTLTAVIALADLGLTTGQTIAVSAFQEGASDGWAVDWLESATLTLGGLAFPTAAVADPLDMADSSGDIRAIGLHVLGGNLYLSMTVEGVAAPSVNQTPVGMVNRYYYHWLLDTDNNPATGRSNAEYEGNPTGLQKPIGVERVIMIGWRNGLPNGVEVYDPLNEDVPIKTDFTFQASGNTLTAVIPLADIGLTAGQTIGVSAFQEGASDGWAVDWLESAVMTLTEGGAGGMTLETQFEGNAYGFEILVTDDGTTQVDPASVVVRLDGQNVTSMASKTGGVTTIVGRHPVLLPSGTLHTVSLSLQAGNRPQSKDFVFKVEPYTVLPAAGRLALLDKANTGFVARVTQISSVQSGVTSLHTNLAELAEKQLAGEMKDEATGTVYYNEVEQDWSRWLVTPEVVRTTVNWFELAPGMDASLNFPNDAPIPKLPAFGASVEGVVVEISTYLELTAGYHKLGLYTEGGHKITAGLGPADPVLSLFDNTGGEPRVPTYFARNQFVDVIATEPGYYPIRFLWFQSKRRQEPGVMLELFSVKDRRLHLLNEAANPKAIRAYRAGALLQPGPVTPSVSIRRQGANVVLQWTGMLQMADRVTGPWNDYADDKQSPLTLPLGGEQMKFSRARSY